MNRLKRKQKTYKDNLDIRYCEKKYNANFAESNNQSNNEKNVYIKKDNNLSNNKEKYIKNNYKLSVTRFSMKLVNQNSNKRAKYRQLYNAKNLNNSFNNKLIKVDKNTNFSLKNQNFSEVDNNKNINKIEKNGIFLIKKVDNTPFFEIKLDEDLMKINKKLQEIRFKINNKEVKFVESDFYNNKTENPNLNIQAKLKNIENELAMKVKEYNSLLIIHNKLKKENEVNRIMNQKLVEENGHLKEKLTILMTNGINANNGEENDGFTLQVSNISNVVNEIESDTLTNI